MTEATSITNMTMVDNHGDEGMTEPVHIAAGEFKARCLKLLDEVAESGEGLVITRRGKPVARLVPMPGTRELFGALAGSVVREDDIVSPIDEDWDVSS